MQPFRAKGLIERGSLGFSRNRAMVHFTRTPRTSACFLQSYSLLGWPPVCPAACPPTLSVLWHLFFKDWNPTSELGGGDPTVSSLYLLWAQGSLPARVRAQGGAGVRQAVGGTVQGGPRWETK